MGGRSPPRGGEDCKHLEEGRRAFGVCKSRTRRRALSKPIVLKLRGRLQFADGQLLGRVGRLCLKAVTKDGYGNKGRTIIWPVQGCARQVFRQEPLYYVARCMGRATFAGACDCSY